MQIVDGARLERGVLHVGDGRWRGEHDFLGFAPFGVAVEGGGFHSVAVVTIGAQIGDVSRGCFGRSVDIRIADWWRHECLCREVEDVCVVVHNAIT